MRPVVKAWSATTAGSSRHHQRQIGVDDRLAVERAEIAARIAPPAKAVLAADVERQLLLERRPMRLEEAEHAAEMVVMAVAEHHGVEGRRIDLEDRQVVEQDFRRVAEIDQHIALLGAARRLHVHREAPFAVEHRARRLVGHGVAALALDGQAVARLVRHELDDDIVGDDAHGETVDLRHLAQRLGRRGLGAGGEGRDHRRDKTGAAGTELAGGGQKRRGRIGGAGAE